MSKELKVTVLGCGGSRGVPTIGNNWGVCDPNNPKNRRTCNAIFVEKGDTKILVDCGPDVRQQINSLGAFTHLDAALITHLHPDHTVCLFELETLAKRMKRKLDIMTSKECFDYLKKAFFYLFEENGNYPNQFDEIIIGKGAFKVKDIHIDVIEMDHGNCTTLGFIFDRKVAYCTDIFEIGADNISLMREMKLDALIIECTDMHEMPNHAHFDKTMKWIKEIEPKKAYLTDIRQHFDYDALNAMTPDNVEPCYDGLIIQCCKIK